VLAPTDPVQKQMADSFITEVKSLGGKMIDVQWYSSGSVDLHTELMALRQKALELMEVPIIDFSAKWKQSQLIKMVACGAKQRSLDSLVERGLTAPVTFLFGERGQQIADSLQFTTRIEHLKYDSLGLPVPNIDAIFVPIASSEEIPIVSSQLKFFNIQAQILGTGDWNDINSLDQNHQYTDGTIYFIDSYVDSTSEKYRSFDAKFRLSNKGKVPGTNVLYGYDVAKVVLQIITQGKSRRADIAAALANVEGFDGLHSKISLSKNRVNTCLTVMQYKGRQIFHIGEIDLSHIGR
jgi:hypothetical protein